MGLPRKVRQVYIVVILVLLIIVIGSLIKFNKQNSYYEQEKNSLEEIFTKHEQTVRDRESEVLVPAGWLPYEGNGYRFSYPSYVGYINPGDGSFGGPLSDPSARMSSELVVVDKQGKRIITFSTKPGTAEMEQVGLYPGMNTPELYTQVQDVTINGYTFKKYVSKEPQENSLLYKLFFKDRSYTVSVAESDLGNTILQTFKPQ